MAKKNPDVTFAELFALVSAARISVTDTCQIVNVSRETWGNWRKRQWGMGPTAKARAEAIREAVRSQQADLAASLQGFQFRDLRAKAASDLEDLARAQELLAHADRSMTQDYVRARMGDKVRPVK